MAVKANQRRARSRSSRSNLPLAAAILSLGLVAAAVTVQRGKAPSPTTSAPGNEVELVGQFDVVEVTVPVSPVPAGTKLSQVRFRTMRFPAHQVPKGALQRLDGFQQAVTLAPLPANLPIFKANLSLTASASNPIIERIPEGMRAITVRVDATSSVEGWAGTGAIVDVLLVTSERASVVAERVKILSAERSIEPVVAAAAPTVPSTVTLLVSQDQALAINAAQQMGRLSFALRSNADKENWSRTDFHAQQLLGSPAKSGEGQRVLGYAAVEGENRKSFALVGDRWVPSDVKPSGFLVAERSDEGQKDAS